MKDWIDIFTKQFLINPVAILLANAFTYRLPVAFCALAITCIAIRSYIAT